MILALPDEFFEGWEWKAGDRVLHKLEYSDEWKTEFILDNGIAYIISLNKGNVWGKYIPLPSQEQLQKMVGLSPNEFIEDLSDYTCEPVKEDEDLSIFHIDMNCFTLAYVMDRKYGKYWNGVAWV